MLAGVVADHWSDSSLLIYADWLEDRGDPRGPFLRSSIAVFGDPTTALPPTADFATAWLDTSGITLLHGLRQCNLADRREEVARLARTTLLIETENSSNTTTPIGGTKFGGCPDLPEGVEWPKCAKGSLAFLAQFKLADLANTQVARRLPSEGMLSFFIFNDEESGCPGPGLSFPPITDTDTIRVVHSRDLTRLRRLEPPADLGEYNQLAPTQRLTLVEALDFRGSSQIDGSDDLAEWILTPPTERASYVPGLGIASGRTTNHFFGWPVYYRMDEPEEFQNEFVHLVTFQNAGDLPFCWGDGADLYFYIREVDLQAAKFNAVAVYSD
jgi:uncharacterized protein (TIGR02996 family)